jgi:hypothetical protein
MMSLGHEMKASYAFIERNFNLTRRYWGWELAFLVYSVAGALSMIVFWPNRRARLIVGAVFICCVVLLSIPDRKGRTTYWSPYQKLTLVDNTHVPGYLSYTLNTNDSWYQQVVGVPFDGTVRELFGMRLHKFRRQVDHLLVPAVALNVASGPVSRK